MINKKRRRRFILIAVLLLFVIFATWQNNDVLLTEYQYQSEKLTSSLDGFCIVQISDLHNKSFGKKNTKLIKLIKAQNPDIIVITGDLVDSRTKKFDKIDDFLSKITKIAPVYFVSGNNDKFNPKYPLIEKVITEAGVVILNNEKTDIEYNNQKINLIGVRDITFIKGKSKSDIYGKFKNTINDNIDKNALNILLSHRPEYFDLYVDTGVDLVFAGHAHGGQIRIPFIGGLFAPAQGLFPKYTNGMIKSGDTSMIVSRGLGNSLFPVRVFNRPEIVFVTFKG